MTPDFFRVFSRFAWLLISFAVILLYALGTGIARYLGASVDVGVYWLGQLWVVTFQMAIYLLDRYFDIQSSVENMGRKIFGFLPYRSGIFLGAAIFLTITVSLTVLLIRSGRLTPPAFTILVVTIIGSFLYAVPPVRLSSIGYGELTASILVANLVPAFAFLLQFGEFHRIMAMATFPITLLLLAMTLVFSLPDYTAQFKYKKRSLIVRMGWETTMTVHNILVLGAFLLVALAAVFGFPSFAAFPTFLPLPLGLLQVWYVNRIANGAKPNWNALTLSAVALFGFMTYVLTFAFWTH